MRDTVNEFIQADLDKHHSDPERNKRWLELLSQEKTWYDDHLIALIRYERKEYLDYLSKTENQKHLLKGSNQFKELWQKNLFVKRTLLARNHLAHCEDFQVTLLTPSLQGQKIEKVNFHNYYHARDRRLYQDSPYERFALDWNATLTRFLVEIETDETARNDLIQQLSQSP